MMAKYKALIKKRDWNMCVHCLLEDWVINKKWLHVHHIKTVGSWWTNDYCNLITLCFDHHINYAHGKDASKRKELYFIYTSQFKVPSYWEEVMTESIIERKKEKQAVKTNTKDAFVKKYWMTQYQYQKQQKEKRIVNNTLKKSWK